MHRNEASSALAPLKKAIELDWRYMARAGTDGDFQRHEKEVDGLFTDLRAQAKQSVDEKLEYLDSEIRALEQLRANELPLADRRPIEEFETRAQELRLTGKNETHYRGYLIILEALAAALGTLARVEVGLRKAHTERQAEIHRQEQSRAAQIREKERLRFERELAEKVARVRRATTLAKVAMGFSIGGLACVGLPSIVGLFLGAIALNTLVNCDTVKVRSRTEFSNAKTYAIIALVVGGFAAFFFALGGLSSILDAISRSTRH
jgi:hypothetical protein